MYAFKASEETVSIIKSTFFCQIVAIIDFFNSKYSNTNDHDFQSTYRCELVCREKILYYSRENFIKITN